MPIHIRNWNAIPDKMFELNCFCGTNTFHSTTSLITVVRGVRLENMCSDCMIRLKEKDPDLFAKAVKNQILPVKDERIGNI